MIQWRFTRILAGARRSVVREEVRAHLRRHLATVRELALRDRSIGAFTAQPLDQLFLLREHTLALRNVASKHFEHGLSHDVVRRGSGRRSRGVRSGVSRPKKWDNSSEM